MILAPSLRIFFGRPLFKLTLSISPKSFAIARLITIIADERECYRPVVCGFLAILYSAS